MPQFTPFDECPQCGVIVSKHTRQLRHIEQTTKHSEDYHRSMPHPKLIRRINAAVFHANPQRTGFYNSPGIAKLNALRWKFKTRGWVASSPVVYDGLVYVADRENRRLQVQLHRFA